MDEGKEKWTTYARKNKAEREKKTGKADKEEYETWTQKKKKL